MVYYILRGLFRITNRFYFKKIEVKGYEHIPLKGPVVFVANHPSAFMDPIVIATLINRKMFFLAKGELFQNKIVSWFLSGLNMIPIFRSKETPGLAHKNKEVFEHCYRHFEKGGAILVFPEGVSLTDRKIKTIKTGTGRICLGAEGENNYGLGIQIVPIGLNFSNPHQFQSELFVNIDKPIMVSDFYELHKADSFKAAHALTEEIRKRLEKQVIDIQDGEADKLVADIETIYKAQLLKDLGHSPHVMEHDFNTTKAISDSVHYFMEQDPLRVEKTKNEIETYLQLLKQLSLNDQVIKNVEKKAPLLNALKWCLFFVLGLPFFVFGFINNYLAYKIPGWITKLISKRPEFAGAIAISLGTFSFLIFYAVQIWFVSEFFADWRIVAAYSVALPITGLFSYYFYQKMKVFKKNWRVFSLFYKKNKLILSLINQRENIIAEFEKGKTEYQEMIGYKTKDIKEQGVETNDINEFFRVNV